MAFPQAGQLFSHKKRHGVDPHVTPGKKSSRGRKRNTKVKSDRSGNGPEVTIIDNARNENAINGANRNIGNAQGIDSAGPSAGAYISPSQPHYEQLATDNFNNANGFDVSSPPSVTGHANERLEYFPQQSSIVVPRRAPRNGLINSTLDNNMIEGGPEGYSSYDGIKIVNSYSVRNMPQVEPNMVANQDFSVNADTVPSVPTLPMNRHNGVIRIPTFNGNFQQQENGFDNYDTPQNIGGRDRFGHGLDNAVQNRFSSAGTIDYRHFPQNGNAINHFLKDWMYSTSEEAPKVLVIE